MTSDRDSNTRQLMIKPVKHERLHEVEANLLKWRHLLSG